MINSYVAKQQQNQKDRNLGACSFIKNQTRTACQHATYYRRQSELRGSSLTSPFREPVHHLAQLPQASPRRRVGRTRDHQASSQIPLCEFAAKLVTAMYEGICVDVFLTLISRTVNSRVFLKHPTRWERCLNVDGARSRANSEGWLYKRLYFASKRFKNTLT